MKLLATLGALMVLSACSVSNSSGGAAALAPKDFLLQHPPTGFKTTFDGNLPLANAASALSTDPTRTKDQLTSFGYAGGAERVWTRGDEYVSDLVFELNTNVGPASVVSFTRSELKTRPAVTLFEAADEPGALGLSIFGISRAGKKEVFCQGVIFPVDRYLFQVQDCAGAPQYTAGPMRLGRLQYERAAGLVGEPVASPSAVTTPG